MPGPAAAQSGVAPTRYDTLFDALMGLPGSGGQGTRVTGLTLRRDSAVVFQLDEGQIHVLGPVGGRAHAAVFFGRGRFKFAPPTGLERDLLKRALRSDTLDRRFTSVFFLFADSTADSLARHPGRPESAWGTGMIPGVTRQALRFVSNRGKRFFDAHFMAGLLNDESSSALIAVVDGAAGGPFVVRIDPADAEAVSLRVARSGAALTDSRAVLVNQFHRAADYAAGPHPPYVRPQRFTVNRYEMDVTIPKDFRFQATATLAFDWMGPVQPWFAFWLFAPLQVDSAEWEGGGPATVVRTKDDPVLWVQRPAGATSALPRLRLHYHGDLIAQVGPWLELRTSNEWYPATDLGYGAPVTASFDLTFHTPRGFTFASVGDRVGLDSTADMVTSRWVTRGAAAHASFNIGRFDSYEVTDVRDLPVTVFMNQEAHDRPGGADVYSGGMRQANMKETVGQDVALSLNFFRDAFGEPVADRFYATEIYGFHGQSFPGLIHFSFLTYQGFALDKGQDEAFRAHEMAHQWWGLGVAPRSYHDAWLSEGFAEFASWWYTEAVMRDPDVLGAILKKSREALLARRRQAGPVWLGTRLGDGDVPQDYSLVIYQKGAWVVRMLRYLMMTPESGEEPFRRMMKDFYQSNRGLQASTEDFAATVSRHVGAPMDWFFDSWVYGTGIPTYEWAQRTEEHGDTLTWRVRVKQKDVPEGFTMLVPVHFYFGDGKDGTVRVLVTGPVTESSINLPEKPSRVVFNESDAVLAEVKEVGWR